EDDADLLQIGLRRGGERAREGHLEHVVRDRVGLVAALRAVREQQGEGAFRGARPPRLGGQPEALLDEIRDRPAHGVSAARVIVVVSRLCHSEAAKASLICSSGYLCERMRCHGRLSRVRTRKSSARGITHGSYWITPTIFLEPHTSSEGSSSILAPRLIVPISR